MDISALYALLFFLYFFAHSVLSLLLIYVGEKNM